MTLSKKAKCHNNGKSMKILEYLHNKNNAAGLTENEKNIYESLTAEVEEISVKESPSKTFPRVNDFEVGSSYRR